MCKVNEKYNVVGESGDEVWINRGGRHTEIKDLSGDHAKAALRQLIKKLRTRRESFVTHITPDTPYDLVLAEDID